MTYLAMFSKNNDKLFSPNNQLQNFLNKALKRRPQLVKRMSPTTRSLAFRFIGAHSMHYSVGPSCRDGPAPDRGGLVTGS